VVANFNVHLSSINSYPVTVFYSTADGTAVAGSDYDASSSYVIVPAGQRDATFGILVHGDSSLEPNESFTVNLNSAINATLARAQATGTIIEDQLNSWADSYSVNENNTLVVPAAGVLANDWASEGNSFTAQLVTGPRNGTVILNADGSFTYTPDANFWGFDVF